MEGALRAILTRTGQFDRLASPTWPVVRKTGINGFGHPIAYYLNYADFESTVSHGGGSGRELLADRRVKAGEKLSLGAWGIKIIEEESE